MMLKNKIAVITGGASGIGEAGTRRFADEGAVVIMLDVNENAGIALEKELCEKGQKTWFIKTDISDENSVKSAFDQIAEKYGEIDVLYNNASVFWINVNKVDSKKRKNYTDISNASFWLGVRPLLCE